MGGDAGLPEGRGSVGKKEGVEAEPLSASARLGWPVATRELLGGRRCKRRCRRRCGASVGPWVGGGGRRGRGGAPGRIGEARGGRWPRVSSSAAASVFGEVGNGERGSRGRVREVGRIGTTPGHSSTRPGEAGGGQGKQEVAEAASARATPRLCSSSWQRRKRTRGRRWAGPARWSWAR